MMHKINVMEQLKAADRWNALQKEKQYWPLGNTLGISKDYLILQQSIRYL